MHGQLDFVEHNASMTRKAIHVFRLLSEGAKDVRIKPKSSPEVHHVLL